MNSKVSITQLIKLLVVKLPIRIHILDLTHVLVFTLQEGSMVTPSILRYMVPIFRRCL